MAQEEYLTISEVANELAMSPYQVRKYCYQGLMGKKAKSRWQISRQELNAFKQVRSAKDKYLKELVPPSLLELDQTQKTIPAIAKDPKMVEQIEAILPQIPTAHHFYQADSRKLDFLPPQSVHLIVTSPPYWTLKQYNEVEGQLGSIQDYDAFLIEVEKVWRQCYELLIPGGRLVCVVGDVLLSRRKNRGRHMVVPLHSAIQEQCRHIGYDNLAPIVWYKIASANFEASRKTNFLGKPYEPNAIIKHDIEFVLMARRHGYRSPSFTERILSVIPEEQHRVWFQQIWSDIPGTASSAHPAPVPLELAKRIIRMFSFVGDIILDPFQGSGTTAIAAATSGRNSINVELDEEYSEYSVNRFRKETGGLFGNYQVVVNTGD